MTPRYVAVRLDEDHPVALDVARSRSSKPAPRWVIREAVDCGGFQVPSGQEGKSYSSWTKAKAVIEELEGCT